MKFTASDEYGIRILLKIARYGKNPGASISALSKLEGLSFQNTAKFCRLLRRANLISSTRGNVGGYTLARPASEIILKDVLISLGGCLYNKSFCDGYNGMSKTCTNNSDCSVRPLWMVVQSAVDSVLEKLTLQDLLGNEKETERSLTKTHFDDQY